jgi:uncharacterized protein (TIGR03435 family)
MCRLATPRSCGRTAEVNVSDTSAASLFTALQEERGLRLEDARAPVEMLVIDRAERPSEN